MYAELVKKRAAYNKAKAMPLGCGNDSKCRTRNKQGKTRKWVFVGCTIGCFCVLAGIGMLRFVFAKEEQGTSTANQATPEVKREAPEVKQEVLTVRRRPVIEDDEYGPKIKGLRLGMKYNDVDAVVERLCDQYNSKPPRCAMYVDRSQKGMIVLRPKMSEIKDPRFLSPCLFDDDGKLVEYGLRGEVFEVAFGLEPYKVSPEEVVQKFLDSYGIPSSNTRVYTFGSAPSIGLSRQGCVETISYYDGSKNGGYSFGFCGRKVGYWEMSFTVHRYLGLDFDLPEQISMSDVENYQYGFGPVIKGFQLGMTRSEVLTSLRKINIVPEEKGDWMMNAFRPRTSFVVKNGKVSEFRIAGDLLAFLFRAEPYYQDIRDFTRQAINFYHVPEVSGKSRSNSSEIATCYEQRMRDGYTGNAIVFWIEELRMADSSYWTIGCRQIDYSNFN